MLPSVVHLAKAFAMSTLLLSVSHTPRNKRLLALSYTSVQTQVRASPVVVGQTVSRDLSENSAALEDLVAWQDSMIAKGKMYRPDNTTSVDVTTLSGVTFSLKSIACGLVVGGVADYDNNKLYLCNTARNAADKTILGLRIITQAELCDHDDCTAFTSLSLAAAGWFIDSRVNDNCGQIFDELFDNCHGEGGSAHVTMSKGSAKTTGTIENQFFPEDRGATCPKIPVKHHICKVRLAA